MTLGAPARALATAATAVAAALAALTGACTVLSGTSELSGGTCARCVDAAAETASDAARAVACGAKSCGAEDSWCCVTTGAVPVCGKTCAGAAAAAISCFDARDCQSGLACCLFRSTFQGETQDRWFSQCLAACPPATDRTTCAPDAAAPCAAGSCAPTEIPTVFACR